MVDFIYIYMYMHLVRRERGILVFAYILIFKTLV